MTETPALSRVLLVGVDSPIGLTVLRELGARGLRVVCVGRGRRSLGRNSRHCARFIERPQGRIADWLPAVVAENDIGAVMAISESDLVQLAALKGKIPGCIIAVPDPEKLALVLDKQATLERAKALGIAVPDSWQPLAGEDRRALAEGLAYPVAIKWADPPAIAEQLAAAGIALEKVEYAADAEALLALLSRYDAIGLYPLVQTYCPGFGLGQMLNMKDGRATLRFQHRRLREWPVTGGVSSYCEAIPLPLHAKQMAASEALLAAIGWEGPAMVEYRHDPATGTYWLMEINGRFWGSIPLAHNAGAHFGWEAWRTQVRGEATASDAVIRPRRARFMAPDLKHLVTILRDDTTGLGTRAKFATGFFADFFLPGTGYYVWDWRDPGPFFGDIAGIIRKPARSDTGPPDGASLVRSGRGRSADRQGPTGRDRAGAEPAG